jgi:hypothetical protein
MIKLIAMGLSSIVALGLGGFFQGPPSLRGDEPPPKAKGKKGAAGDDLRKTYDLLRRIRAGTDGARTEERISDWTLRATRLYRQAIRSHEQGEPRRAREYSAAAHDLARAVDHAQNAARFDRPDPELPLPPDGIGPKDLSERTRRDLARAYDRIQSLLKFGVDPASRLYLDAARDLYNAARRDVQDGREERGGELARAAEAMTHVPEHLSRAGDEAPDDRGPRVGLGRREEPKKKDRFLDPPPREKGKPAGPRGRGDDLPPPLR